MIPNIFVKTLVKQLKANSQNAFKRKRISEERKLFYVFNFSSYKTCSFKFRFSIH